MKFIFYTNSVSPHQIPLAREIVRTIGAENYRYIYTTPQTEERRSLGWPMPSEPWIVHEAEASCQCREWLECSDVLMSGIRDVDLLEHRAAKGLKSLYVSERWFKPPMGALRMFVPSFRKKVKRFVNWANSDSAARVFAIGPWAAKDFVRMGINPNKIVDWGYFVEPSVGHSNGTDCRGGPLRLLWCGRLIALKHVSDIIKAVRMLPAGSNVELTIVGKGPEKPRLMKLAEGLPVVFNKSQPIDAIRQLMREHDTLVFASNGYEGWGAVVSEALEEGMNVIGTYECGAPPTLLPKERLYHCGDVKALANLMRKEMNHELPDCTIGDWTAARAADRLLSEIGACR